MSTAYNQSIKATGDSPSLFAKAVPRALSQSLDLQKNELEMKTSMKTDTPFIVTEWDWFMLKLEHSSIWDRGSKLWKRYSCDQPGKLICTFHFVTDEYERNLPRDKRLFNFYSWVNNARSRIGQILQSIPVLRKEFSVERDIEFRICEYDDKEIYSTLVCSITGDKVVWAPQGKPC